MEKCLNSTGNVFHISAFSTSESGRCLLFSAVLLMYLTTILGNMTIALLVCLVPQLHTPMYFFLGNLAIADIIHVSVTLPKLLSILLTRDHRISFSACMTQVYFFSLSAVCDIFVLTSMSYDRYVAVCKPLQYSLLISKDVCNAIIIFIYFASGNDAAINVIVTSLLTFCPTQNVDHFFCELTTLYSISSSDTTSRSILLVFQIIFLASLPFLLIITSYIFIISAILNIQSSKGRRKAFSSCSSHLTTVIIFFGPIIILYSKPGSEHSRELEKLLSLLYTAVVPMLNPFVYTLRNTDILNAIRDVTRRRNIF
ncbi:olfactory receptor 50-like [Rana temporaria]|uniref:olfactory receptor 50-like n=1 Tax=Rana temporaria TaxID=8407 RepID=UPI001AACC636|nr:olfactory receptor 50-like [Rana temporaria]